MGIMIDNFLFLLTAIFLSIEFVDTMRPIDPGAGSLMRPFQILCVRDTGRGPFNIYVRVVCI